MRQVRASLLYVKNASPMGNHDEKRPGRRVSRLPMMIRMLWLVAVALLLWLVAFTRVLLSNGHRLEWTAQGQRASTKQEGWRGAWLETITTVNRSSPSCSQSDVQCLSRFLSASGVQINNLRTSRSSWGVLVDVALSQKKNFSMTWIEAPRFSPNSSRHDDVPWPWPLHCALTIGLTDTAAPPFLLDGEDALGVELGAALAAARLLNESQGAIRVERAALPRRRGANIDDMCSLWARTLLGHEECEIVFVPLSFLLQLRPSDFSTICYAESPAFIGKVIVLMTPNGAPLDCVLRAEQWLLSSARARSVLIHRPDDDLPPESPVIVSKDDVREVSAEISLSILAASQARVAGSDAHTESEDRALSPHCLLDVQRLHPRSLFDPDVVKLQWRGPGTVLWQLSFSKHLRDCRGPLTLLTDNTACLDGDKLFVNEDTMTNIRRNGSIAAYDFSGTKLSAAEQKKARRRARILGNTSLMRLGWFSENDAWFHGVPFRAEAAARAAATEQDFTIDPEPSHIYVHYPWVLDNLYHQHNDNLLPLLLLILQTENIGPSRMGRPNETVVAESLSRTRHRRVLVMLPTRRRQVALSSFLEIIDQIFGHVLWMAPPAGLNGTSSSSVLFSDADCSFRRGSHRGLSCSTLNATNSSLITIAGSNSTVIIWGRPPRPFAKEATYAVPYATNRVVRVLNALLHRSWRPLPTSQMTPNLPSPVFVTWIARSGTRSLFNDGALLGLIQSMKDPGSNPIGRPLHLRTCCDNMSYAEQFQMMQSTDILIGVHGAGLLHLINLRGCREDEGRGIAHHLDPLVVHIGSQRLNYHEQVVIERLALLCSGASSRVRYMSTRTRVKPGDGASWQNSFHLPEDEMLDMWMHAMLRYNSGL